MPRNFSVCVGSCEGGARYPATAGERDFGVGVNADAAAVRLHYGVRGEPREVPTVPTP